MDIQEDLINFNLPEAENGIITIIGVGGGGNNAVNRMYEHGIKDVDYIVANTDIQVLSKSLVPSKIHLGETLTEGRGTGNRVDLGKQAAIESSDKIRDCIKPSAKMAFIVAGLGRGTGTGATPVIAGICKELGILTVGVVTLPFMFEGQSRMNQAVDGINRLKNEVDSLLIIHNEKLREIYGNLTLSNAFATVDNILLLAVKGISEIITYHGFVNVDFADVKSIIKGGGIAFMGSASTTGEDRAKRVVEEAIISPLLNNNDINGARKVLLNITSGSNEITVDELVTITEAIIKNVQSKVNTIWGVCTDETLGDEIRITLIATGFGDNSIPELYIQNPPEKVVVELPDRQNASLFDELDKSMPAENKAGKEDDQVDGIVQEDNPGDSIDFSEEFSSVSDDDEKKNTEEIFTSFSNSDIGEELTGREESLDSLEKINSARLKALNYNNYSQENIDKMEREPAYKRMKDPVQPEIFPKEESESRYTIGNKDAKLRANNSFLYDPVD